ncbi:trypsin, alkaline C-like [Manduca sexta]|uniref:trypsin, alkaline C-like n=1 Tax=Manduca sexta TaxID=7130 RepID=UPI00189081DE|nr:trypsin, alkaline C-like [Manduca sexta]
MGVRTVLLVICLGAAMAVPATDRIVGGQITTVTSYPEIASLARRYLLLFYLHSCGGTILTTKSIMTAAHCVYGDQPADWRIRVGSTYSNSGGSVYNIESITIHPSYDRPTFNNDVAIMRTQGYITYGNLVQPGSIAGANFAVADNSTVVAAGWGSTTNGGAVVSQLRHVALRTVNQMICALRYNSIEKMVNENMLCAGWLNVGGKDTCQGDSGGPLYYGRVVVGITSWGAQCAVPEFPGVYTRVPRFTSWVQANA